MNPGLVISFVGLAISIAAFVLSRIVLRRVRVRVHRAFFDGGQECYFVNVTNVSLNREVEVTHVWFDLSPRVHAIRPSERPSTAVTLPSGADTGSSTRSVAVVDGSGPMTMPGPCPSMPAGSPHRRIVRGDPDVKLPARQPRTMLLSTWCGPGAPGNDVRIRERTGRVPDRYVGGSSQVAVAVKGPAAS